MQLTKSKEWLEELLSGQAPTAKDVRKLVKECPYEDLNIDYKSGHEFDDKGKAAETLREYTAAFANSDGGILLVGYHANKRKFDGAIVPGGRFDEWVARVLYSLRSYLHSSPRAYQVEGLAPHGSVLLLAVARSAYFVPVDIKGIGPVYYLRIGDSNYPPKTPPQNAAAPHYLVSDLLLGRRNQPLLAATMRAAPEFLTFTGENPVPVLRVFYKVRVENVGLSVAEDVRLGAVAWAAFGEKLNVNAPPPSLLAYLNVRQPEPVHTDARFVPHHVTTLKPHEIVNLRPFEQHDFNLPFYVPFASLFDVSAADRGKGLLLVGVYLAAKNAPPLWYQLTLAYRGTGSFFWSHLEAPQDPRPQVTWRHLPTGWETDPSATGG